MSMKTRRSRGVAAASMAGVGLFPFYAVASAGNVEISINGHSANDPIDGPNVSIETEFHSKTSHGISRVEFLVDGQVIDTHVLDEPLQEGKLIFAWDTTRLTNDIHTVTARAYDDQNQVGSSDLQLFVDNQRVDTRQPVLRITFPKDGAVESGQFDIRAQSQEKDPANPIKYLMIKLDNDLLGVFGSDTSATVTHDGNLPDGPHRVVASAELADGSQVVSPPIIVVVSKHGGNITRVPNSSADGFPSIDPEGDGPGSSIAAPPKPGPDSNVPIIRHPNRPLTPEETRAKNDRDAVGAALPADSGSALVPASPPRFGVTIGKLPSREGSEPAPFTAPPVQAPTPDHLNAPPSTSVVGPAAHASEPVGSVHKGIPAGMHAAIQESLKPSDQVVVTEYDSGWHFTGAIDSVPQAATPYAGIPVMGALGITGELQAGIPYAGRASGPGRSIFNLAGMAPAQRSFRPIGDPRLHPIAEALAALSGSEAPTFSAAPTTFAGNAAPQGVRGALPLLPAGSRQPIGILPVLSSVAIGPVVSPALRAVGKQSAGILPGTVSILPVTPLLPAGPPASTSFSPQMALAVGGFSQDAASISTVLPGMTSIQPGAYEANGKAPIVGTAQLGPIMVAAPVNSPGSISAGGMPSIVENGPSILPASPLLPSGQPKTSVPAVSLPGLAPSADLVSASGNSTAAVDYTTVPVTPTRIVMVTIPEPLHPRDAATAMALAPSSVLRTPDSAVDEPVFVPIPANVLAPQAPTEPASAVVPLSSVKLANLVIPSGVPHTGALSVQSVGTRPAPPVGIVTKQIVVSTAPIVPASRSSQPVSPPKIALSTPAVSTPPTFSSPVHARNAEHTAAPAVREALRPLADDATRSFRERKAHQPGAPEWLRVAFDNHLMKFDVPPMMVHNVPMAPFRSLFERSGGEVEWAQKDNIVTGRGEGKVIIIRIGSRKALINNQVVRMAMPAFIRHGRTMVPLGFLGQTMDVNIQWNRETGEIAITSKHVVAVRVPHRD